MPMRRMRVMIAMVGLVLGAACASNPRPGVVYARRGPPRERVEVVTVAPSREEVWVKGHWTWVRNDYEWVPGRWVRPDRGFRDWVAGRWEHDRYGWYYVEGHWR